MQKQPKLTHIVKSLKTNPSLWQKKLYNSWQLANQAGLGFTIGEADDSAAKAIIREGYEFVAEFDDFVVGTNSLTSILIVTDNYSPWAVDITDILLLDKDLLSNKFSQTNKIKEKNIIKYNQ